MGSVLQGLFPSKLMRICTRDPMPVVRLYRPRDLTRPTVRKGKTMRLYIQNRIKNLALKGYGYNRIADILAEKYGISLCSIFR